ADTVIRSVWPSRLHARRRPPDDRTQPRYLSPQAKTQLAARRAFHTSPPGFPVGETMAPALDNARQDRADRTPHTAPGTIASLGGSATGRPTHADVAAAADEADRPRRTPPTRRPPASLLADGEACRVPGSGSCSPRVPGPTADSPILPPQPTPEHRRI